MGFYARKAQNLVANGGFETNTTGWSAYLTAVIARSTVRAKYGGASLLITPGAIQEGATFTVAGTLANTTYAYSCWVYSANGGTYYVQLSDAVDQSLIGPDFVVPAATWTRVYATGTTDATANRVFFIRNKTTADAFNVDGVQVETGSVATPYVETNGAAKTRPVRTAGGHFYAPHVGY